MATKKQNLNWLSISEDFTVQKNAYVQREIQDDGWFNRFAYSYSNIHSPPPFSTVLMVYEDLQASVSNAP